MFKDIQCVTFDLDNTLWPIEPTILIAEEKLFEWISDNFPKVTAKYSNADIAEKRAAFMINRPDIAHDFTQLRWHSLMELAEEFDYPENLANEGLALFRKFRNQVDPYSVSEPILAKLKQHFKLGVITNGNAQVEKTSLADYFEFVVSAADAGVSKPHSKIFERAALMADVPIQKILHVGDCATSDVLGAMDAGCISVWLNMQKQPWPGG
ncbi:MAG: HAD-IA family hydrolase, partial [Pseudomonadota bacterium]